MAWLLGRLILMCNGLCDVGDDPRKNNVPGTADRASVRNPVPRGERTDCRVPFYCWCCSVATDGAMWRQQPGKLGCPTMPCSGTIEHALRSVILAPHGYHCSDPCTEDLLNAVHWNLIPWLSRLIPRLELRARFPNGYPYTGLSASLSTCKNKDGYTAWSILSHVW